MECHESLSRLSDNSIEGLSRDGGHNDGQGQGIMGKTWCNTKLTKKLDQGRDRMNFGKVTKKKEIQYTEFSDEQNTEVEMGYV